LADGYFPMRFLTAGSRSTGTQIEKRAPAPLHDIVDDAFGPLTRVYRGHVAREGAGAQPVNGYCLTEPTELSKIQLFIA